jgi:hypothetical protein
VQGKETPKEVPAQQEGPSQAPKEVPKGASHWHVPNQEPWLDLKVLVGAIGALATAIATYWAWTFEAERDERKLREFNQPINQAKRALEQPFFPKLGSIGPEFENLHPEGFDKVFPILDNEVRQAPTLAVIDGMSGIGKTFALKKHLQGQTGVIFISFRDSGGSKIVDSVFAEAFG